jgi:hypothetical protein
MLTEEYNGEQIEVEEVQVTDDTREPWSVYVLADGTQLSLKNVLLMVTKSVKVMGADGKPLYFTRSQPITKIG